MFITFEGVEGCGKSTQLERLAIRLEREGRDVLRTREPGGTDVAEEVRGIFLRPRDEELGAEVELFLVLAARASHVRQKVKRSLERGTVVLCDRFADATLAYQGHARGLDLATVRAANALATDGLRPDWTIVLDLPVRLALERVRRRAGEGGAVDRLDAEIEDFHHRVRAGYRAIADSEPDRVSLLDGDGSPDEVEQRVVEEARRRGVLP